ncbi:MAG: type 1 glutamine amidotransferase, partial [Planctomycetales bacterium]|nr:type 1 glutamine amidotransferase [Planctomycetales bacterium]
DLITQSPTPAALAACDVVLLGGSGHYSATGEADWLDRAFDALRNLHHIGKPTFASCWGFQAFARALGGVVRHDLAKAELGTHTLNATSEAAADPIFAKLGKSFAGQMGHEDYVQTLPPDALRLASTRLVQNQAFRFADKPIYCTQFHPELNRDDLLLRVRAYPSYIERVAGMTLAQFEANCRDTPETEALLTRFVRTTLA